MIPSRLQVVFKWLSVILVSYALVAGLWFKVPKLGTLGHSARNLFYHVPMWFAMYVQMGFSFYYSIQYLRRNTIEDDLRAEVGAKVGILFGVMGLLTGSVWSRVTWGEALPDTEPSAWWAWDPKQTFALIAIMVYVAYFLLRASYDSFAQKAKFSAIYNIFAAISLIPLTLIIPRILGGLHPGGSEGSPVFNQKDISNDFRIIFYPAIIGFISLSVYIANLNYRILKVFLNTQKNNQ